MCVCEGRERERERERQIERKIDRYRNRENQEPSGTGLEELGSCDRKT